MKSYLAALSLLCLIVLLGCSEPPAETPSDLPSEEPAPVDPAPPVAEPAPAEDPPVEPSEPEALPELGRRYGADWIVVPAGAPVPGTPSFENACYKAVRP